MFQRRLLPNNRASCNNHRRIKAPAFNTNKSICVLETPSAASQMRLVVQQHGFGTKGGLMTGCTATLGRHGVWNAIYFGLFRTVMPIIVPDTKAVSKTELNTKRFLLGCICGTLGKLYIILTGFLFSQLLASIFHMTSQNPESSPSAASQAATSTAWEFTKSWQKSRE